jgi:hypothetical protein
MAPWGTSADRTTQKDWLVVFRNPTVVTYDRRVIDLTNRHLMPSKNWTAKIEYFYIGTNVKQSGALSLISGTVSETANVHDSLVRAGVNFKFP